MGPPFQARPTLYVWPTFHFKWDQHFIWGQHSWPPQFPAGPAHHDHGTNIQLGPVPQVDQQIKRDQHPSGASTSKRGQPLMGGQHYVGPAHMCGQSTMWARLSRGASTVCLGSTSWGVRITCVTSTSCGVSTSCGASTSCVVYPSWVASTTSVVSISRVVRS